MLNGVHIVQSWRMDVLSKEKVSSQQTKYIFVILDITRNMTSSYLTSNLKGNKDSRLVLRRVKLKTRTTEQALEGRIVWTEQGETAKLDINLLLEQDWFALNPLLYTNYKTFYTNQRPETYPELYRSIQCKKR